MKNHVLIMDGNPEDQKKIAEVIKELTDPAKTNIHMLSQTHSAKEVTREHPNDILLIVVDNNLKQSNVNKFISGLSNDHKGKVVVYSADDNFRLICSSHMYLKIASKKKDIKYLEKSIMQVLDQ